jgi:hypothetical protein
MGNLDPSPDEMVARFEARTADDVNAEQVELRDARCILFNRQDLMQRMLATTANRAAAVLELDVSDVTVDLDIDDETKRFVPKLVINAREVSVDAEKAQQVFNEELAAVNTEWRDEGAQLVMHTRIFPDAPSESLESFKDRLRKWLEA